MTKNAPRTPGRGIPLDNPMTVLDISRLRTLLAQSCRILAATGCVREITGHVSARIPGSKQILVRCRRSQDPGVEFTEPRDIRRVGLDATNEDLSDGYSLPGEFAIHAEIYRSRPDVMAVVHGHPESSLVCGIAGIELNPIFGAYDPGAMALAAAGIPVYPRSVLISTAALGRDLSAVLADKKVCLLAGHGIVATGGDIKEATMNAIRLEALAAISLRVHSANPKAPAISSEDITEIQEFVGRPGAATTYASWTWDFYVHRLGTAGNSLRGDENG